MFKTKIPYKTYIVIISLIVVLLCISTYHLIYTQINLSSRVMQKHAGIFSSNVEEDINAYYIDMLYLINTEDLGRYLKDEIIDPKVNDKLKIYYEKYHELITSIKIYDDTYQRIYYRSEKNYYNLSPITYVPTNTHNIKYSKNVNYDNEFIALNLPLKDKNGIIYANIEIILNLQRYLYSQMKRYYIDDDAWLIVIDTMLNKNLIINKGINLSDKKVIISDYEAVLNMLASKLSGKSINYIKVENKKFKLISGYSPIKIFDKNYGIIVAIPQSKILQPVIINTILFSFLIVVTFSLFIVLFRIYRLRITKAKIETIQSESSFKTLIDVLPIGVISYNNDDLISIANPQLYNLFALNTEERIVGKKIDDLDNSDLIFAIKFKHSNIINNAQRVSIVQKKEKKWFLKYQISHFIGSEIENMILFVNITEQENALRLAKESNKAKVEFLSNISHEIKTPLTSIKGFSNLLLKKEMDEESFCFLENIRKSSDNLLDLFTHILNLAKLEANQYTLKILPVDINQIIREISKAYQSHDDLDFEVICSETIPIVLSDSDKLKLILHNLLNNAFKFTKKGNISFITEILTKTDDELVLKIKISDTGIGIAKDKQEIIFEPFVQADGSFTREHNGIGIGLAISAKLAKLLNSSISLEESNNGGSSFSLILNLKIYKEQDLNQKEFDKT